MQKVLLFILALLTCGAMQSQVQIGKDTIPEPGTLLDLNSAVEGGLLLPGVFIDDLDLIPDGFTGAEAITDKDVWPALTGAVVWNTNGAFDKGVYVWDGESWGLLKIERCSVPPEAPGAITITPASPVILFNGTFTASVPKVPGMTYTWTLPSGLTGSSTDNSIVITGAAGGSYSSKDISVTAVNADGCTSAAGAGTGTGDICVGVPLRTDIPESITIGGAVWATRNVDEPNTFADHASSPGMLYQWGRKVGYSASEPGAGISIPGWPQWDELNLPTSWPTENNPCPSGYVVPTQNNMTALRDLPSVRLSTCDAVKLGLGMTQGRLIGTSSVPLDYDSFDPMQMLFIPIVGVRMPAAGQLNLNNSHFWSSQRFTLNGVTYGLGYLPGIDATASVSSDYCQLPAAHAVRCIAAP